jgi:hypothetical protein
MEAWEDLVNSSDEKNLGLYQEARQLIVDFYNPLSQQEFESQSIEFTRLINVTESEHKGYRIGLYEQRNSKKSFRFGLNMLRQLYSVVGTLSLCNNLVQAMNCFSAKSRCSSFQLIL